MKFKCPRVFYVKGKKWQIKFVPTSKLYPPDHIAEADAVADLELRIINVDKKYRNSKSLESLIMHELYHALFFESHLTQINDLTGDIEEIMCDMFADAVTTILKKYFYK